MAFTRAISTAALTLKASTNGNWQLVRINAAIYCQEWLRLQSSLFKLFATHTSYFKAPDAGIVAQDLERFYQPVSNRLAIAAAVIVQQYLLPGAHCLA